MDAERIEFVDRAPVHEADDDVIDVGTDRPRRPRRRWLVAVVGLVVAVLVGAALVGRAAGDDGRVAAPETSPRATPSVPTDPVVGIVGLPGAIGAPRELVSTSDGSDIVWMLDRGAGIVRLDAGRRTAVQLLEAQVTAIAVSPDGKRLYVATAGDSPSVQILDATTLGLGPSRVMPASVGALAVSSDAVWAVSGAEAVRLDLRTLQTYATVALPGVIAVAHLRISFEEPAGSEQVVGVGVGAGDDGATVVRLFGIDELTQQARFGPAQPSDISVATTQYLTWIASSPAGAADATVDGYVLSTDSDVEATAKGIPAGSRIYDAGGGYPAFYVANSGSSVIGCHDGGGFPVSEVDLAPSVPDALITGQVLRTGPALYAVTDRGLVRSGVGACA